MSLPTGLSQRGGVWQLRIGVPADLRHLYPGIDAYRGSLRTRDRSEAITKAHVLHAQYRQTFDRQRATEAVRRAPPNVPLTSEIEAYLIAEAEWIGTALRAVDPPLGEALITAVMGHEAGNVGAANYHRPAAKTLQRVIETLDFPAVLALPRIYPVR